MKKTKVVVTGGAGFIGSNLTDFLLGQNLEVHIVDNLSGGKKENINPKAVFHKVDIREYKKLPPIFKGAKYVFHLAALPRVQKSIEDPLTTHDVNVTGTLNVLWVAHKTGVKRVVYSASSSAYGNQSKMPLREDMTPNPLSPYGLHKYVGEMQCQVFNKVYGLETVSLRYFNVYGPKLDPDGAYALVIGRFLKQRKDNKSMTIVPDGKQSRDFTHVRDVVRANWLASNSNKVGKGEVINIGAGNSKTILEIAKLIGGPTVFIKPRLEPKATLADISKAKKLLGWKPEIKIEDGISELKKIYGIE